MKNKIKYPLKTGFNVFAGILNPSSLGAQKLSTICSSRLSIHKMDITNKTDVEQIIQYIKQSKLPLWALVNNAGIGASGFTDWGHDVDEYKTVFEVNVFGLIRVTKNCLPLLRQTNGSRIVNVASLAGRLTPPCMSHYAMSKHAVRAYSDALRRELYLTKDNISGMFLVLINNFKCLK